MNELIFLDDATLIERVRGGVTEALSVLWMRYYASAYNYARMQGGRHVNDSDDIVTDAFAKIWQAISRGRGPTENFRAYLYATIRTVAADRQTGVEDPVDDIESHLPSAPDHSDMLEPTPERDLIARCFYELGQRSREVLWLSAVEGLKPAEIGARMGLDARYVSVLSMRARGSFRKLYNQAVEQMTDKLADNGNDQPDEEKKPDDPKKALGRKLLGGVAGLTAAQAAATGMAWASTSAIVVPPAMPGIVIAAGAAAAGAGGAAAAAGSSGSGAGAGGSSSAGGGGGGGGAGTGAAAMNIVGAAAGASTTVVAWVIGTAVALAVGVGALTFGYLVHNNNGDNLVPPAVSVSATTNSTEPGAAESSLPFETTQQPAETSDSLPPPPSSPTRTTATPSTTPSSKTSGRTTSSQTPSSTTSGVPTDMPTSTSGPTISPTHYPSSPPTTPMTEPPIVVVSTTPEPETTNWPSTLPPGWPAGWGSNWPPGQPTVWPSNWDTNLPTVWPTAWPDHWPTNMPMPWPSTMPAAWPSGYPTNWPTSHG